MTLNRLTCLLVAILTLTIQSLKADPLQTHDQYLRHYETGFYSGLDAEVSPEAESEKSERDEPIVNGEFNAIPERYAQLGLEPLEQVFDFAYTRFRDGDRQSLILKTRGREIYLLVFDRPISPRNEDVHIRDSNLRAGFTRVWITDRQLTLSRRLEAIYKIENREKENEVLKFLRAND